MNFFLAFLTILGAGAGLGMASGGNKSDDDDKSNERDPVDVVAQNDEVVEPVVVDIEESTRPVDVVVEPVDVVVAPVDVVVAPVDVVVEPVDVVVEPVDVVVEPVGVVVEPVVQPVLDPDEKPVEPVVVVEPVDVVVEPVDVVVAPVDVVVEPVDVVVEPVDVVVEPVDVVVEPVVVIDQPVTDPVPITAPPVDAVDISTQDALTVSGGRVTTLQLGEGDDVSSARIIGQPDVGNVSVNPDNTFALVLSHQDSMDFSGALDFTYEVTFANGSTETITQNLNVEATTQLDGWGEGNFYMLETDDDGELVIEHGDNHQTVHISGSDLALSREEIAEIEGLRLGQINGEWLANSDYGSSPDMALDAEAGLTIWAELVGEDAEPGSHWMLFESGYDYGVGRVIPSGAEGESELHPLYIGSYGDGDPPVLNGDLRIFQESSANIVLRDVAIGDDFQTLEGGNYILDGINNNGFEIRLQSSGAATVRDSIITDSHKEDPAYDNDIWDANADRVQGLYSNYTQGLLIEGNLFDLNGWETDYSYDLDSDAGQAPSQFSHNIYVSHYAGDVTLRDNIILRGASFGAQIRPGGFIEDNVFAGNNIGVNFLGGKSVGDGTLTGNYSFFTDNVVTSGGFHAVSEFEGATTWAIDAAGQQSTLFQNIVTHLVEPDTTIEFHEEYNDTKKTYAIVNDSGQRIYFDDTIVYNWALPDGSGNEPDANIDGLDTDELDQATIENFTAALLSQSDGSVEDLATILRAQADGTLPDIVDADLIINYFQTAFGISASDVDRSEADVLRFIPSDLADGIRWDNRINWDNGDLPGTADGDSVDLGGNWVVYGGTTTIEDLETGSGGALTVTHGYLEVDGDLTVGENGGQINIDNAGQVWVDGYSDTDALDLNVDGGRFANEGDFNGTADIDVTDNAQAILATAGGSITIGQGSSLSISGSDAKVGFDGETGDVATLEIESGGRIDFIADADGFSGIEEFRSGHYDQDTPNVLSGINLGGSVLGIDITQLGSDEVQDVLLSADEILGNFDKIELIGLDDDRDATLVFDFEEDMLSFEITASGDGSGQFGIEAMGTMDDVSSTSELWNADELWNALTDGQGSFDETFVAPDVEELDEFSGSDI